MSSSRSPSPVGHSQAACSCVTRDCNVCLLKSCGNDVDGMCIALSHHVCKRCSDQLTKPTCPLCRRVMQFKSNRFNGWVDEDAEDDRHYFNIEDDGVEGEMVPPLGAGVWHPAPLNEPHYEPTSPSFLPTLPNLNGMEVDEIEVAPFDEVEVMPMEEEVVPVVPVFPVVEVEEAPMDVVVLEAFRLSQRKEAVEKIKATLLLRGVVC